MSITLIILFIAMFLSAGWAFTSFVRAARFARKNEESLQSIVEKGAWWLLMFKKNTYGPDVDAQRKSLALQLGASVVTLFAVLGLMRWLVS